MAEKQLYVIDDFTGSMNSEADASDLQPNESLYLENIYPSGKGKLTLDRKRCTVAYCGYPSSTTTVASFEGVASFRDTMDNIVVVLNHDQYMHVLYASGDLYTTTPSLLAKKELHDYGAGLVDTTKANFVTYNGICRVGTNYYEMPPTVIMNFGRKNGASYVNRQRFASANFKVGADAGSHGIALFVDDSFTLSHGPTSHTDFALRGCGVYPPRLGIVDADGVVPTFTYDSHSIGVYIRESSGTPTTASDSEYTDDDRIWFGFSLEYDFQQESPMAVLGTSNAPTLTITNPNYYPLIDIFVPAGTPASDPGWWTDLTVPEADECIWDERITGINIYRKVNDGDFFHIYKIDVTGTSSLYDDSDTGRSWSSTTANYYKVVDIREYGKYHIDTYYSHSGFNDYIEYSTVLPMAGKNRFHEYDVMLHWNIGCIFREMAVVATTWCWDRGAPIIKPHKRVNISMPGKPDVFHPDHWLVLGADDSSEFRCIQPLGTDRVAFFDENNTYILNASSTDPLGWYLERTYNVGIASGNAWASLPDGLAFANSKGVYVLDFYGALTEVSRRIRSDWAGVTATGCFMQFDRKTNVLYIAKTGIANGKAGLQLDMENGSWSWWSDDASTGSLGNDIIQNCMGMFPGYNQETHLLYVTKPSNYKPAIYEIMAPSSGISIRQIYQSPHIDFGSAAAVKTGKHLYVKYIAGIALTVTIYIDGSSSGISLGTVASSSTATTAHLRIPYRFRTISVRVETSDKNSGAFELHELGIEFKQGRAK